MEKDKKITEIACSERSGDTFKKIKDNKINTNSGFKKEPLNGVAKRY